ncbi:cation efflux protein [Amanita rubescens]|nr:cation efflux protein [Amanita rubescens]
MHYSSRSSKIIILLVIDLLFFFVELIVGYAVGSLALVADSFHMLNDVMSLVVALYAIKLASKTNADPRYSYGWHRAEILAALINGVFLLALCFSITLEALERFFSPPEISQPRIVVIVGALGLLSNMVGLFLFHDHSHAHTPAKNGHSTPPSTLSQPSSTDTLSRPIPSSSIPIRKHSIPRNEDAYSSLYDHPAATRAQLVQAANEIASAQPSSPTTTKHFSHSQPTSADKNSSSSSSSHISHEDNDAGLAMHETTPLLLDQDVPQPAGGHGHSHSGSMNMRALVLHVLGDALGNVGVIASGLIIWLTTWSYKYYSDPVISLVITVIIFSSALPLVRSTSFILLQGVPHTVSLNQVRRSILGVEGVLSLHELHIWQLSESKIVASVHVLVASRKHEFMLIAANIRRILHQHGVHSSTIQPEYRHEVGEDEHSGAQPKACQDNSCLILCPADKVCDPMENACCPPAASTDSNV